LKGEIEESRLQEGIHIQGGACRFLLLKDGTISILEGFSYPK
jgi:hypothetical protein